MKKQIVIGTKNPAKVAQINHALSEVGIKLPSLVDFVVEQVEIVEDGQTAMENARKKALGYAKHLKLPVLATDNALFFDSKDFLPGHWLFAICIVTPDEKLFETTLESPRTFVCRPSQQKISGYPLESLQVDPGSGKYISEMSTKERLLTPFTVPPLA
ncbi:non-canonical purine NTP pyrophosphatase [Patescibacteria group bacterium]